MENQAEFKLGQTVMHKRTEYHGTVIAMATYIDASPQASVQSPNLDKDGRPVSVWIELGSLSPA